MPIDPNTLAEARALVAKAGMSAFVPPSAAPASTGGQLISIALIDPFVRGNGTPNFDKPDPDRPDVVRSTSLLEAFRDGTPIPPLLLFQPSEECRYELMEGFHRFHLCAALGYTHIPAIVRDGKSWGR